METKNSLKTERILKELSIKEVADKLGLSMGAIKAIEEQKFIPNVSMAIKIARFFGLNVEDIFNVET